tara:strand:- start:1255 stop:2190 length:936 start_codon:yes stop_codon:yes gene_type:complete
MVSLSPQILLAITKQLAKQAEDAKRIPEPSMAPVKETAVPSKSLDDAMVERLKQGARDKQPLGTGDASQRKSIIPRASGVADEFGIDDVVGKEGVDSRVLTKEQRTDASNNAQEFTTQEAIMKQARDDAASKPLRADEVVNPIRQKEAELDLEGLHVNEQMDKIQEIIDADPGLSALSPALLKESMPNVISNNRDKLGIKNDVSQESTSVFQKLNDLAESAADDPKLAKQIQVFKAQAAQANERGDYKTLQLMLEQLTGTDAGLEGLSRFGRGRPTVPNDPTSLPINIPSKDKTATMEQIMKAVTQELGIK